MRTTLLFATVVSTALAAAGWQETVRVEVRDDTGAPVPYALVGLVGGVSQVANDSGVVRLRLRASDSLNLNVRRIGHREFFGWVVRGAGGSYRIALPRLSAALSAVTVTARESTPLTRTGFYERVDQVQYGATVGDFLTPEDLEARNASTVSRMLAGSRYARVKTLTAGGRGNIPVIVGRGGCAMTILVDGQQLRGTVQDAAVEETPTSINRNGSRASGGGDATVSVDDLVDGRTVMAIEIYPSTANAPARLQTLGGRGSCGIVAIWTGPRQ